MLTVNGLKMQDNKTVSRREFILKAAFFSAGALAVFKPFRAVFAKDHSRPKIALIIDDVGYSIARVKPFLELGVPVTFSILPRLTYSHQLALKITEQGHEVMLHQPMEPYNPCIDPGPGAVYMKHTGMEIENIIKENIELTPLVSGVNNHMGSMFTESKDKIRQALRVFKEKDFFFIDSYTSSNSQAFFTAKRLKMRAGFRNVFLDNSHRTTDILLQLEKVKKYALRLGYSVGIGHPVSETAEALSEFLKSNRSKFDFVYASRTV